MQVEAHDIPRFFPLFQEGVILETDTGASVREFLCRSLGLQEDYVEKRISTIFLDGKPVDNLDASLVNDGSVLALSAAMPGLVGATLRKGGYYAPMRKAISHHAESPPSTRKRGKIRLKLFNMILQELAPRLLYAGVWVPTYSLKSVIENITPHSQYPPNPLPEYRETVRLMITSPTPQETKPAASPGLQ